MEVVACLLQQKESVHRHLKSNCAVQQHPATTRSTHELSLSSEDVVVVGAGVSGLTAAHRMPALLLVIEGLHVGSSPLLSVALRRRAVAADWRAWRHVVWFETVGFICYNRFTHLQIPSLQIPSKQSLCNAVHAVCSPGVGVPGAGCSA